MEDMRLGEIFLRFCGRGIQCGRLSRVENIESHKVGSQKEYLVQCCTAENYSGHRGLRHGTG
jgi:hypothetical protein